MLGSYANGYRGDSLSPGSVDGGSRSRSRPNDFDRRRGGRPSFSNNRSLSHGRGGVAEQQVEDVLDYMKQDWPFMVGSECLPAYTALQFLDDSSLGLAHRSEEFYSAHQQLQSALRAIVNEHYQGFNSAIGTYHQLTAGIQASHDRIRELRQALVDSKTHLTSTKSEFSSAFNSARDYSSQLETISALEQIQGIPEVLESRMSEKRFITAVESLQEALRLLISPQLEKVAALDEMKVYMSNQEHALSDILVEELHNHLYLKSPYCETRWTEYAKLYGSSEEANEAHSNTRDLYDFLDQLDTSTPMHEDTSRTPEANSFQYIHIIVEALHKLSRLEDVVEIIEERLPMELYRVLERTSMEIEQRHPSAARAQWKNTTDRLGSTMGDRGRERILKDLLGTLYARFEAIAESFRVFHEVTEGVCKRVEAYDKSRMTRSFRELWKLYQSEMRSLLHDYLSTDGSSERLGHGLTSPENVFRQQRDRSKVAFRMEWLDTKDQELKNEQEDIKNLWQKQVPGLSSLSSTDKSANTILSSGNGEYSSTGHKTLVEPSVFNITYLLPPSVMFLKRLKEVVPPTSNIVISTLSSFLNDFLINVFHPQLEETLVEHCSQSVLQLDAFQQLPQWSQHSQKPIFKGAARFMDVISAFCQMLASLTHDQLFSKLVITQMNAYYDKCCAWYKALVTRAKPKADGRTLKAAAFFSEEGSVAEDVARLLARGGAADQAMLTQEIAHLVPAIAKAGLDEFDLLIDRKIQASLCLMYTSMKWLASRITQLRYISPKATDQTGMEDEEEKPQLKRSITTALAKDRNHEGSAPVYLPLSHGTSSLFDGIIEGFEELADSVLRTLHLELRCHIAQSLGASFKGSLLYSDPADAPDEDLSKLLKELLGLHQELRLHLLEDEYSFIVRGVGEFADTMLLGSSVANIASMNANGCSHMFLNVQVLHHSLLHLEPGCTLPRSNGFFRLFERGPDAIIAAAYNSHRDPLLRFDKKEHEALLKLWYSEKTESDKNEEVVRGKKSLEEKLGQLSEVQQAQ